ncbi:hypothetical protein [Vibrio superstes]|uniref:Uncharacterized protein n=1 Tax=Vibrio superstes NBRC 103154 TaxID=1219062 RepID=A0A511QKM9_9VIBR|nr:hypothetical protein [Vibrio superstes]GEM77849.1 hypothetical protein VSU01S_00940 [Vibrio superstes NBRC 103154]
MTRHVKTEMSELTGPTDLEQTKSSLATEQSRSPPTSGAEKHDFPELNR